MIYQCYIQPTGRKVYKIPDIDDPMMLLPSEIVKQYANENEIAITMPESEYIRFCVNWNNYLTIMEASLENENVKEQYKNLIALANLFV